ncbi:hypothetical protein SAMN04487981_103436 [Streptomyces sp. cf386]|uniref:Pycsar system effector family protein n=1 Tax=Streptomyces sp. cf386 TaxID=1761904 RepID=UPI000890BCD8|nr:Pycsar system effector family protein [Streptomyces sp. cf386]SDN06616.1 hypothetical protein SAMN04487981_103436 [Streptomyces sp. cf386]
MSDTGSGTPSPPGGPAAERLLADLRSEIARADAKASVLVAALGAATGVIGSVLGGRTWAPPRLSALGMAVWCSGLVALAVTLLALLMAVLPRHGTHRWTPGAPLSYFGDIQRAVRSGHLAQALAETERAPAAGTFTALTETSRIAVRKHQWIRTGLIALGVAVVTMPLSLLIG